ncbi:MAG: hypothetical protein IIZ93_00260 [Acidaminococcaceae bacterium]|nr:hypothetical protein [Acidaminococcaceae bacterium]
MKTKFLSFVFPETTKKQIDAMPAEMKLRFYVFVTDYGMYDKEPEDLTEIEKLIWIPMKDLIDSCKSARGGAPEGNQNAKKTTETTKNNQNNVDLIETTETTLSNDNGNGNGKVKENDNTQSQSEEEPAENVRVPAYIPDPNQKINKDLAGTLLSMIVAHNSQTEKDRKVPVSNNIFTFSCKEMRELIAAVGPDETPAKILTALENYLKVCRSDTWMRSHTWSNFCKHYTDYTPEFFTWERYLNAEPQTDDATQKPEYKFYMQMRTNAKFHVETFQAHIDDWKAEGRPEGADYLALQDKWEAEHAD